MLIRIAKSIKWTESSMIVETHESSRYSAHAGPTVPHSSFVLHLNRYAWAFSTNGLSSSTQSLRLHFVQSNPLTCMVTWSWSTWALSSMGFSQMAHPLFCASSIASNSRLLTPKRMMRRQKAGVGAHAPQKRW